MAFLWYLAVVSNVVIHQSVWTARSRSNSFSAAKSSRAPALSVCSEHSTVHLGWRQCSSWTSGPVIGISLNQNITQPRMFKKDLYIQIKTSGSLTDCLYNNASVSFNVHLLVLCQNAPAQLLHRPTRQP